MKLHSTQSRPNVVRCISRERRAQAWAMMAYQDCRRFQTRHLQMCLLHTMDMDIRSSSFEFKTSSYCDQSTGRGEECLSTAKLNDRTRYYVLISHKKI